MLLFAYWKRTQLISLLPSLSAYSRSVMEMRHSWKSLRCGSAKCCAWGVCVCVCTCEWVDMYKTHNINPFLCVHAWGWLFVYFCQNWLYAYAAGVCVCTTADTHRDTGLSPPVCTISSNDDTLWLIEFLICLPTSRWHPFHLRYTKKWRLKSVCVCVSARSCVLGSLSASVHSRWYLPI